MRVLPVFRGIGFQGELDGFFQGHPGSTVPYGLSGVFVDSLQGRRPQQTVQLGRLVKSNGRADAPARGIGRSGQRERAFRPVFRDRQAREADERHRHAPPMRQVEIILERLAKPDSGEIGIAFPERQMSSVERSPGESPAIADFDKSRPRFRIRPSSTVGPDGTLYATEAVLGSITRIDPHTGETSLFASGLPTPLPLVGFGGAMDLAFLDGIAYVIVTMVDETLGGAEVTGVYRMDGPASFTPIADIGAFALAHPPDTDFDLPTGVQYSMETYRGGLLVADGHHNRVLEVRLDGDVSEFKAFDNIVPTGLEVRGRNIYMAQAGPAPHLPADGKVVTFTQNSAATEIASGAMLAVDVEFGRGQSLYVLSQGEWNGDFAGSPANPDTGALFEINRDGTLSLIVDELNLPTSVESIGNDAYIVNLLGEIWVIENVGQPPFGRGR